MSNTMALTAAHLERAACVYIRQSSEVQVQTHVERQRLQYALADHAKELGFRDGSLRRRGVWLLHGLRQERHVNMFMHIPATVSNPVFLCTGANGLKCQAL